MAASLSDAPDHADWASFDWASFRSEVRRLFDLGIPWPEAIRLAYGNRYAVDPGEIDPEPLRHLLGDPEPPPAWVLDDALTCRPGPVETPSASPRPHDRTPSQPLQPSLLDPART